MNSRDRPHIFLPGDPTSEPFTSVSAGGGNDSAPFGGNRANHGKSLTKELETALDSTSVDSETSGTYITFESFEGLELSLESLDPQRKGEQPELLSVQEVSTAGGIVQYATVFIPDGKRQYFIKLLSEYVATSGQEKAANAKLVEGIRSIQRATIRQLWTDPDDLFPNAEGGACWWEVWLRNRDGNELQRFTEFAARHSLETSAHYLGFGDRTVALLRATTAKLTEAFDALDDIAELRLPHDDTSFLTSLSSFEQRDWENDLLARLRPAEATAPVVCVLDTGVQASHPLLRQSLAQEDVHSADPAWSLSPIHRHGTEMAGLALYGDLNGAIVSSDEIRLHHGLESVIVMPGEDTNARDLFGAITARAIDLPEIQAADRRRVFMLAVSARASMLPINGDKPIARVEAGKPTSWSSTIDALSFGRAIDDTNPKFTYLDRDEPRRERLFIVSTGNIRDVRAEDDPLARSDLEPVEDPAQAWNAIAVGAYAEKDNMAGAAARFDGYVPLAKKGELSPVSRTSVTFDGKKWPFKPDVVADGGNVAASPGGTSVDTPENLALLTTRLQRIGEGPFTTTRDTSAATAQVAGIAADIFSVYPDMRPETVRALVVHSAEWTDVMKARVEAEKTKSGAVTLLHRYGMGVPNLARAIRSATDALTLVAESTIHPYEREGSSQSGKAREMNLHELPWPTEQLASLGEANVRLRVTLSYFVEPNPSSRGWTGRYIYPSHGLRFAVLRPEDRVESFRQRINLRARDDGSKPIDLRTEKGWTFGSHQQDAPGSLHTDIWTGTAAELASKGAVAIYPVAGWWKNRPQLDQSDSGVPYSLVVSIESPDIEVDLWTPVAAQVATGVEIEI